MQRPDRITCVVACGRSAGFGIGCSNHGFQEEKWYAYTVGLAQKALLAPLSVLFLILML